MQLFDDIYTISRGSRLSLGLSDVASTDEYTETIIGVLEVSLRFSGISEWSCTHNFLVFCSYNKFHDKGIPKTGQESFNYVICENGGI